MGLGRRRTERQEQFWIATEAIISGPRHAFYDRLNKVLDSVEFDRRIEDACEPYYAKQGRLSIPPGVYFRMLLIGYFEGIDSQRGIAWRCEDSRSLSRFLGFGPDESTPDHSSLTVIRKRLPMEVHDLAFQLVLKAVADHGLLKGNLLGVDATDLEANAAMKSIVRRDTGDDWREYVRKLYEQETGISDPDDEELRRFDKRRKDKQVSNEQWVNPNDPDAKIGKMKDGRTHLKYKAEHAVDLETTAIVSAEIYLGDQGDSSTIQDTVNSARTHLRESDCHAEVTKVVADKGYHSVETVRVLAADEGLLTYIPEREQPGGRRWTDKCEGSEVAFRRNRQRVRRRYGRKLQRWRSERVERTFAHVCETGGGRRSWLRGRVNVQKRHLIAAAGYNLGLIMRKLLGVGKPKQLSGLVAGVWRAFFVMLTLFRGLPLPTNPQTRSGVA
jgi:transposase